MEGDWVVLKEVDGVVSEMVGLEVMKDCRNPCAVLGRREGWMCGGAMWGACVEGGCGGRDVGRMRGGWMCGGAMWGACVEGGCVEIRAVEDFAMRGRMCVIFCFLNLSMQTQLSWWFLFFRGWRQRAGSFEEIQLEIFTVFGLFDVMIE